MSGHSKWHNIQARKGKQDAKRSASFSKFSNLISVAARQGGGDQDANFSLRLAVDRAKAVGVPKDNIERAIKSGTGELKGKILEELTYECYGSGGVAVLVKVVTDNKNRIVAEIKHIFSKNGGSMGSSGSVLWMFDQWGMIVFDKEQLKNNNIEQDDFELQMMDVGAEDIEIDDEEIRIKTKLDNLQKAISSVKEMNIEIKDSGLEWIAKDKVKVDEKTEEKLNRLFSSLTEHEDVEDFYTNAE